MVALDITTADTEATPSSIKNPCAVITPSSATSSLNADIISWISQQRHQDDSLYAYREPLLPGFCLDDSNHHNDIICKCSPMSIVLPQKREKQLVLKCYSLFVALFSWLWIHLVCCFDRMLGGLFPEEPELLDMDTCIFFIGFAPIMFFVGQTWLPNFFLWLLGLRTSEAGDRGKGRGMRKSWSPSLAFGLSFLKSYLRHSENFTIEEIQSRSRSIPFMTAPFGILVHKVKIPIIPYRVKAEAMVNDCLTDQEKELVYPCVKRHKRSNFQNVNSTSRKCYKCHRECMNGTNQKEEERQTDPYTDGLDAEWLESTDAIVETGSGIPETNYGVVIYYHGGGYYTGSKDEHRVLLGPLAKRLGKKVRILNVGYRLAPQDPFPAALVDALSCYMWVLDQSVSDVFGLNNTGVGNSDRFQPNQVVFMGDSAGSGLVISLSLLLRDHGTVPQPLSIVAWSPWLDLTQSLPSFKEHGITDCIPYEGFVHQHSAAVDMMFEHQEEEDGYHSNEDKEPKIRQRAQVYCPDSCLRMKYVSPLFETDFRGITDIFITCGSAERFYNECVLMAARLEEQQQRCRIDIHDDMPHIFQLFRYHPSSLAAISRSSDYIREMINKSPVGEPNGIIPIIASTSSSSSSSSRTLSPLLVSASEIKNGEDSNIYYNPSASTTETTIGVSECEQNEGANVPPTTTATTTTTPERTNSSSSLLSIVSEKSAATFSSTSSSEQGEKKKNSGEATTTRRVKTIVNVVDQTGVCILDRSIQTSVISDTKTAHNDNINNDNINNDNINNNNITINNSHQFWTINNSHQSWTINDIVSDAELYEWKVLLKQGNIPTRHWPHPHPHRHDRKTK